MAVKEPNRAWDVVINDGTNRRGFILSGRSPKGQGRRQWRRQKIRKGTFTYPLSNVQPGRSDSEFIINFDNQPALGWGESLQRTPGKCFYGENVDYRFDGMVFLGPLWTAVNAAAGASTNPTQFVEMPTITTKAYLLHGEAIRELDASGNTWAFNANVPYTGTATRQLTQAAALDQKLFVCEIQGTADGSVASAAKVFGIAGGTITDASQADADATNGVLDCVTVGHHTEGAVLYATGRFSNITRVITFASGNAQATTGDWALNVRIAATGERYRWAAWYAKQAWFAAPTGVYAFDEDYKAENILPELEAAKDATNGIGMKLWNGGLIIPHVMGLSSYFGDIIDISPWAGTTGRQDENSRRWGRVVSIAGFGKWLYAITNNGTDTYVFAGKEVGGQVVWYTLSYFSALTPYTAAHISAKTTVPTFLLAMQGPTAALQYSMLSRVDNPLQDNLYEYAASGIWYTPLHDIGIPGVNLTVEEVVLFAEGITTTETIAVAVRTSGTPGTTWTTLGTANVAGQTIFTFTPSTKPTGSAVQFRISFARGTTKTLTPIFRSLQVRVQKRFDLARRYTFSLLIQDPHRNLLGADRQESVEDLQEFLDGLDTSTTPFTFWTPDDLLTATGRKGLLDGDGAVTYEEVELEKDQPPALLANVMIREIS